MTRKGWRLLYVGAVMMVAGIGWAVSIHGFFPSDVWAIILAFAGTGVMIFVAFSWAAGEFGINRHD